ncbi:ankyrin repeat domain-containing protein 53 [Hemicordylus capensis]|uniref:ankyrin repeat domain-containing protein 53 n=1 Tax=Hemicordylus capensis TaxID=884348 RepID=UPI0023043818|nr:ankyrin repeat domain-containing protein 53 [Hemicordylus capensis]
MASPNGGGRPLGGSSSNTRRRSRWTQQSSVSLVGSSLSTIKASKPVLAKGPSKKEALFAASTGQVHWLQLCLQKTESPTQADINGFSALHTASLHGRLDCIQMLVEKYGVDVDLASLRGWRPIHLVISKESGDRALECLQYLIGKGADVNVQNQNGVSPLHKAASEGRENCIQALIEAGANVHAMDSEGQEPLDLCRMWGHRACAKTLSCAIWKIDKAKFAQEVSRLNEIKAECEIQAKEAIKREQMDLDMGNMVAYAQWLEKKHLPPPSDRILGFMKKRAHSVALRRLTGRLPSLSPSLPRTSPHMGEVPWKDRRQRPWNVSTNVASMPVTCIFRPNTVRIGTQPEKSKDHDFTSFLFLLKNAYGEPEIHIDNIGRVPCVPELPLEVIRKSLYPHTWLTRLEVPQDFTPKHIFDVGTKRRPDPEHWWTDQMAVSLRETLDPAFIGTLEAHLATYTDPTMLFPKREQSCASGKESFAGSKGGGSCGN